MKKSFLLISFYVFLFGCKEKEEPVTLKTPIPPNTIIEGKVLNLENNQPISDIPIWVNRRDKQGIYYEGLDGNSSNAKPAAFSDKNGYYKIEFEAKDEIQYYFFFPAIRDIPKWIQCYEYLDFTRNAVNSNKDFYLTPAAFVKIVGVDQNKYDTLFTELAYTKPCKNQKEHFYYKLDWHKNDFQPDNIEITSIAQYTSYTLKILAKKNKKVVLDSLISKVGMKKGDTTIINVRY